MKKFFEGTLTVFLKCCSNLKISLFVLYNATAESMNCSLLLKNLETHFCNVTCKKTSSKSLKIYRNIYRKNLSAKIYRSPISLEEIEIYRLSISPRAFLKLSIIVIAFVQKGLSWPSLLRQPFLKIFLMYYTFCLFDVF